MVCRCEPQWVTARPRLYVSLSRSAPARMRRLSTAQSFLLLTVYRRAKLRPHGPRRRVSIASDAMLSTSPRSSHSKAFPRLQSVNRKSKSRLNEYNYVIITSGSTTKARTVPWACLTTQVAVSHSLRNQDPE